MRRALVLTAAVLASITVAAAQPAAPAAQPFRQLASQTVDRWQVAWIGNDEKVNHCIVARGTSSDKPTAGEPKFMFVVDRNIAILRLRAAPFQFTGKKALQVRLVSADGTERKPPAATAGPDLADMKLEPQEMAALLAAPHADATVDGMAVRLSFDGAKEIMTAYRECLADIGKPAKGWSNGEIDQLIKAVKTDRAKCVESKRANMTMCDVN